jgi:mRNA-degrading endonuclease toxin of MazEF toxin-antitoxin module
MTVPIRRGSVLWVPDTSVQMPPSTGRDWHPKRPVLVLSRDLNNTDSEWPIFMGCPISSASYASEFDVKLAAGLGGLTKKGWVRVALLQPFAKTDAIDRAGQLDAAIVDEVIARLLMYTGAID